MKSENSICFVTIAMKGGGTERVIALLSNQFVKLGYTVTIMMIADHGVEYELSPKIHIVEISGPSNGKITERIRRICKMRGFFSANKGITIYAMGTVAAMFTLAASVGLRNRIIISERNDPNRVNHKPITKKIKLLRNILYKRASKIVFQTEDAKKCFPERLQRKSVVIPNPAPEHMPEANTGIREKVVVTAGRLTKQKNHELLIRAFTEFSKKYKEYSLKIYGVGEMEAELQSLIEELHMRDRIFLCGFSNQLYEDIRKCFIYVSSSDWEGISNSLVEALALGIPTIATDCPVGGSRMCIRDGINGFIIPVGNKDALIEKMELLASNEELAEKMSQEAVHIKNELSVVKITDKWRYL